MELGHTARSSIPKVFCMAQQSAAAAMVAVLQARNTGDYRPLDHRDGLSRVEAAAWFAARAGNVSTPLAGPEMDLIVWQGCDNYEIKVSPPNHLFGVGFCRLPAPIANIAHLAEGTDAIQLHASGCSANALLLARD